MPDSSNKVSVIASCYNDGTSLPDAVESVFAQRGDWVEEMIVVNDGSTDETSDVLDSLKRRFSKLVVVNQENAGLPAALNRAMSIARSDFFAILDADDIWLPEKLEMQMPLLQNNDLAGISYTDFFEAAWDDLAHRKRVYCRSLRPQHALEEYFVHDAPMIPSTVILRRRAVESLGGFDPAFRVAADNEFWIRMLGHFEPAHLPVPLTVKRVRPNSLGSDPSRRLDAYVRITQKAVREFPALVLLADRRMARRMTKTAQAYLRKPGGRGVALTYLAKSIKSDPTFFKPYILFFLAMIPPSLERHVWKLVKSLGSGLRSVTRRRI